MGMPVDGCRQIPIGDKNAGVTIDSIKDPDDECSETKNSAR